MKLLIIFILANLMSINLTVKSPAFMDGDLMPVKYTCDGANINPPITVGGIPANAKTLALIMDDPDAKGTFDHWVIWNIPVKDMIAENSATGKQGKNGKGESKYLGPCPPTGLHHYHFKVYALDASLDLPEGSSKKDLEKAMKGHILSQGELIGLYKKLN